MIPARILGIFLLFIYLLIIEYLAKISPKIATLVEFTLILFLKKFVRKIILGHSNLS